jgi:F-type H+-transporting ATPase subunit c
MMKKNLAVLAVSLMSTAAMAQEHAAEAVAASSGAVGAAYWAAGICMGLAAAVVGFSQSRAAVAALEGISRNPSATKNIQTPLILSLALMESLVLFAFVVAFTLAGK